jgi:protein-disulfide isomerase
MKRLMMLMAALLFFVQSVPPARAAAVELQPLAAADVARVLAAETGKAQIVEIWSLDCSYCRENVARIAQWQLKHRDVRVTMIAMDSLDDNTEALSQALAAMELPPQVAQYANAEAIPEKLRRALDPEWRGELPRTVLIDARGKRQSHSGLLAPHVLDQWHGQ